MKIVSRRGKVDDGSWPFVPVADSSPPPKELLNEDLSDEDYEVLRKTSKDVDHYDSWKPSKDLFAK